MWKKVKLEDIAAKTKYPIGDGDHGFIKPSQYLEKGIPYIRVGDIDWIGNVSTKNMVYISEEVNNQNAKSHLFPGDIIIAKTGATIGKVAIIPDEIQIANTTSSIGKISLDTSIAYNKFIFFYLKSNEFQKQMWAVSHKSAQPGFNIINLKKFTVPLPSLNQQIHIANILTKAETLIQQRKQSIALLDEFLKSTFLEMFGDPVRNEKGWDVVKLSKFGKLDRGISKHRPRNAPELLGGKYPLIQTGEVSNAGLYITSFTKTYSELGLQQSKLWKKDTLLITVAANIAKTAILTFDACFPDSIVGFTTIPTEADSVYVHFLFSFFQKILEENAPQAAQKNINLDLLRNLKVPQPPIELQNEFSNIVAKTETLKQQYQQSLQQLQQLFGSLSQQAFKGALVSLESVK